MITPETEVEKLVFSVISKRQEADRKGRLSRAAPVMLEALEIALKEMEYVNRPQSRIAREKVKRAIIKVLQIGKMVGLALYPTKPAVNERDSGNPRSR